MMYDSATILFYKLANVFWGILAPSSQTEESLVRTPWKNDIYKLANEFWGILAPSSQTEESLVRTPWKNDIYILANVSFFFGDYM